VTGSAQSVFRFHNPDLAQRRGRFDDVANLRADDRLRERAAEIEEAVCGIGFVLADDAKALLAALARDDDAGAEGDNAVRPARSHLGARLGGRPVAQIALQRFAIAGIVFQRVRHAGASSPSRATWPSICASPSRVTRLGPSATIRSGGGAASAVSLTKARDMRLRDQPALDSLISTLLPVASAYLRSEASDGERPLSSRATADCDVPMRRATCA